jgi:hypothetical protein
METDELIRRYGEAVAQNDFGEMKKMRHPDWREDWPQSGERIPNHDAYQKIHEAFPAGMPRIDVHQVAGAEDRWVMTPSTTVERIAGSGDVWFTEGVITYASGEVYHIVQHLRLRDGLVWRTTTYFAEKFEAPEWRAPYVVAAD